MGPVMDRLISSLFVAALGLAVLASSHASAQASADQRARELYLQGDRHYSEGRYELAVTAFQESYALSGRPLLLYNLANAYERLGRHVEALDALRRYQPHASPDEQLTLSSRIAALEARIAQQMAQEAQARPEPSPEPVEESRDSSLMVAGLATAGGGVALLVVGTVMGVLALDARSEAQNGCVELGDRERTTLCDASVRDALERDGTYALVADIGIATGIAAIAAGATLVVLDVLGEEPSETAVIPYVAPRAEGAEVGVVVSF